MLVNAITFPLRHHFAMNGIWSLVILPSKDLAYYGPESDRRGTIMAMKDTRLH